MKLTNVGKNCWIRIPEEALYHDEHFLDNIPRFDVVVHFLGKDLMEREHLKSGALKNTVMVGVDFGGFSGPYEKAFSEHPQLFEEILKAVQKRVSRHFQRQAAIENLAVTAWSGGYGAEAAILRDLPESTYRDKLKAVVMIDGIHTGYTRNGSGSLIGLNPAAMEPFLRFAQTASADGKFMGIVHSSIVAVSNHAYCSSTDSANWLTWKTGGKPQNVPVLESDPYGLERYQEYHSQESKIPQGFHVWGFKGQKEADHVASMGAMQFIFRDHLAPMGFH